jgi:hypothetical protein
MATTQIDGARQIKSATITNAQIAAGAAIDLSKLSEAVIQADGGQAFTGNQSLGGNKLTSSGNASADSDVPNYGQVKALMQALDRKDSVRVAVDTDVTIANPGTDTFDGITLAQGDALLLTAQATGSQNGIYIFDTDSTPLVRRGDADSSAEVTAGLTTVVEEGTYADKRAILITNNPIVLGTTALDFTFESTGETVIAGDGLTKTGSTIDVVAGDSSLTANANDVVVNPGEGIEVSSGVRVKLDGSTLARSASGLKIAAAGVTETELAASVAGNGLTGGAGTPLAVNTGDGLEIASDAVRVKLDGASIARSSSGIKVDWSRVVKRETPTGSVNGVNTTFTLANTPIAGTEEVFLNGILQEPGAGNDYTISGATITYLSAPLTGDRLRVNYIF